MKVLIENQAKDTIEIHVGNKVLSWLNKNQLKQNRSVCGMHKFVDVAEALNYVSANAYTQLYELDLYSEPDKLDVKITILDGDITKCMIVTNKK